MRNIKGIFPGVFTVGNMFCGFLSILSSFEYEIEHAAWLIILAAFFDALDGRIARFSRSSSKFGVELDSFADFVSFGVAPAILFYSAKLYTLGKWGFILGLAYMVCGAFRLARFNLQARQEVRTHFVGLPIPMAAVTLSGYILFCYEIWNQLRFQEFIIAMVIGFSGLMVSQISYETLPNFSFDTRKNRIKFLYLLLFLFAALIKPRLAFFPFGFLYITSGVVREIRILTRSRQTVEILRTKVERISKEDF